MSDVRVISACRLCGSALQQVLELRATPPANDFLADAEASFRQRVYPLELMLCQGCGHLQLHHELDRQAVFTEYLYASGISQSFRDHFRRYAEEMRERFRISIGDLVVDVGSNDGTLLQCFKDAGMRVLGVDPAYNLAAAASDHGIPTLARFFGPRVAMEIRERHGRARLVTANNVFAHVSDLHAFVAGVRELLAPDGVLVFEVSYALDVLQKDLFDTVYHEHLDYHSVTPLAKFFAAQGFTLFDLQRIPTHGGSIRGYVGYRPARPSVDVECRREAEAELSNPAIWEEYGERIREQAAGWQAEERRLRASGTRLCAYGASAKATTLLYQLGADPTGIEFCVDDSPLKQGRHLPGTGIPIVDSSRLYEAGAEACLLLAWNVAAEIMERHRTAPVRFILPPCHRPKSET